MKKLLFFSSLFMGILFLSPFESFAQWTDTNGPHYGAFISITGSGNKLFAGTNRSRVYLSTDNGDSWTPVCSGLPNTDYVSIYALAISGTNIFAGTDSGAYFSTNDGRNWTAINSGLTNKIVIAFALIGTNIFAGTFGGGVFLSTNNGTNWTTVNSGLTNTFVRALAVDDTNLFVGANFDVFRSTDYGTHWTATSRFNSTSVLLVLAIKGTHLFAGTRLDGVFHSINNGNNWSSAGSMGNVSSFTFSGTIIFAAINSSVFHSADNGIHWTEDNSGLTPDVYSGNGALTIMNNYIFMATEFGTVWRRPLSEMITGLEDQNAEVPQHIRLNQNYPNPFNPVTTISFTLPQKSFVSLKIFDALGREIVTLINGWLSAGGHLQQWNVLNISSGVYFYQLTTETFTETKKLVVLR